MTNNSSPPLYFDVIDACAKPGCPFCRLAEKVVNRYLDALMYENVNDPDTRETLHQSLGFCNEHAWRLPSTAGGAALGIAIIYRDLIGRAAAKFAEARFSPLRRLTLRQVQEALDPEKPAAATEAMVRSLQRQAECPACAHRDRMITIALNTMLDPLVSDERLRAALNASSGLCLPHLLCALELTRDEATFTTLMVIVQEKVAGLKQELDEFIRKSDYRFNKDGFGLEGDSWRRGIAWMVGAKGVRCN